jgi:glycosyltransferase 2 family protein
MVTLPREEPPSAAGARDVQAGVHAAPAAQDPIQVEDRLESRVRIPADLLRCVIAVMEIVLLAALGLLAKRAASGAEYDIVLASRHLGEPLLSVLGFAAHAALFILPVWLAVRMLIFRQPRRLAEAAAAGAVTVGVVLAVNLLLTHPVASGLYDVLSPKTSGPRRGPLDGYLSGLTAYVTVIGLSGRPRSRTVFWLAVGFFAAASFADAQTTVFSLLIALLLGMACGSGLRYAFGSISERPSAAQIAEALCGVGTQVVSIRRVWDSAAETRRYTAALRGGGALDVTVLDRDQQAADLLYRLYRRVRLRAQVSRSAPFTVERAMERRALLTYAAEDAGILTPRLRAVIRVGPEAAVLANDSHDGTTLAEMAQLGRAPTDAQVGQVWDAVLRLHSRRVTHRALTADRILLLRGHGRGDDAQPDGLGAQRPGGARQASADGEVMLLDPGNGDVAASDLQLRLDLAQLLAELALLVGPDRAVSSARGKISSSELAAVAPLIQPVVLHRSTRAAVRRHTDVLPALRRLLRPATADPDPAPVQVERIRLRTLVTLVAVVFAAYILAGELARTSFSHLFLHANWHWTIVALGLSALTYVGAALELSGFVLERLKFARTFVTQVACSFVTLVTPAAVGGAAVNIRYLRKAKVAPADAVASVGVSQVIAFVLHLILLAIFVALAGTAKNTSLRPPGWAYIAAAVLVAAILVTLAVPAGRKLLLSRVATTVGQVIPRLLDIAQQPAKLAEGIGGALLVTAAYICCLDVSIRAFGGSLPFVAVAVVYLTGNAIGSAVPTPGGIGAVEAALSAGLTTAGLKPAAVAISAVLLFRAVTFWLPVPVGWAALGYLQRRDVL